MRYSQDEILTALQIIHDTCKEHTCEQCPFQVGKSGDGVCGLNEYTPDTWVLNSVPNWKAFSM